jgi:cell division protein FtsB
MAFSQLHRLPEFLPDAFRAKFVRLMAGRRRTATLTAAVLALGVGYHVVFGANGLFVYRNKRQESKLLQRQMLDLARENQALRSHVEQLQSDPGAIEHQAREQLHYARPGEVIYTLPGN